jgi:hypothetical protein
MTIISNKQATIDTVLPTLSLGQIQVSAHRRSTKEKPLTDAERIRCIVLPAGHWGELAGSLNGEKNQSLTDVLRGALQSIAGDRLRDTLAAEPMQRMVALSDYSVTALLAWNSETASGRGSITFTREQVETWFDSSATNSELQAKWAKAGKVGAQIETMLQFVRNRFATLAAKNHGLKEPADCDKLTSLIAPADLDGSSASLMVEVMGRLDHIRKQLIAKAAEATISMDDL